MAYFYASTAVYLNIDCRKTPEKKNTLNVCDKISFLLLFNLPPFWNWRGGP